MLRFFRHIRQSLIVPDSARKYLLYAIGEILLVVIGILVALQVNNWNEANNNALQANELKKAILADMQADIQTIDSILIRLDVAITEFDRMQSKITHPEVTEEEVIRIIKNDFNAFLETYPGFNDNSYRSASSSGTLAFIPSSERTILYELYLQQMNLRKVLDNYEDLYLNAISVFIEDYPLPLPFIPFSSGPVYEQKWNNVDFNDLTSKFNSTGGSQRNYYRILKLILEQMRELTIRSAAQIEIMD